MHFKFVSSRRMSRRTLLFCTAVLLVLAVSCVDALRRGKRERRKGKNCYELLGVEEKASTRDIQRQFRKMAMKYHPDKVSEGEKEEAEEKFKELAKCYEILKDEDTRSKYDASGFNENFDQAGGGAPNFEGFDFGDLFSQFFGGGPGGGARAGRTARGEQFFSFSSGSGGMPFGFGGQGEFPGGSAPRGARGSFNGNGPGAGGSGGGFSGHGGTGRPGGRRPTKQKAQTLQVKLRELLADHTVTVRVGGRRVDVEVPAGAPDGTRLKEAGVVFEVKTRKDSLFERRPKGLKSDVYHTARLTLADALLGADVEVPTIDGGSETFHVDRVTPGMTHKIKGRGLPRYRRGGSSGSRGNMIVDFDIVHPELSNAQRDAVRAVSADWKYPKRKSAESGSQSKHEL